MLKPQPVRIGFIGAGSYAQSHLLPNILKKNGVSLKGVMTTTSTSSRSVAERFGFEFCTSNENDIFENEDINTVFIATRHDSHAEYVLKAINAGKHVFVEKPLCLTVQELGEIAELLKQRAESREQSVLMVGYNRRFAPLARIIKQEFGDGPMAMFYRINAGVISPDSWIQDAEIGGGRVIGEVCHFVDFLTFVNGSLPVSVYTTAMNEPNNMNDILNISLAYQNGSIGTISYFANGDKSLPKEYVEIYASGSTAVLNDFKNLVIHANGKKRQKKVLSQDKGQENEVKQLVEAVLNGTHGPISFEEIYNASLVTFKIVESIRAGEALTI